MTARRGVSQVEREDMAMGREIRRAGPMLGPVVELVMALLAEGKVGAVCAGCGRQLAEERVLCAEALPGGSVFKVSVVGPECAEHGGSGHAIH